jgi:hypothetical protein
MPMQEMQMPSREVIERLTVHVNNHCNSVVKTAQMLDRVAHAAGRDQVEGALYFEMIIAQIAANYLGQVPLEFRAELRSRVIIMIDQATNLVAQQIAEQTAVKQ